MSEKQHIYKNWSVWSNLCYIAAGVFGLIMTGELMAIIPAVALVFLGIGSGIYHYNKTDFTVKLDYLGMYLVAMAFPVFLAQSLYGWIFSAIIGAILIYSLFATGQRNLLYVGAINLPLFLHVISKADIISLIIILGVFIFALALRLLSEPKYDGKSEDYLHALWHLLTSIGYAAIFLI